MQQSLIIGVLAFQGDFAEHLDILRSLKVDAIEVRNLDDLAKVQGLIIPGGESTVISKFLRSTGVGSEIKRRVRSRGTDRLVIYGTCAGAIVLAKLATGKNVPQTLELIDITVDRNAYGSQIDSFETTLRVQGITKPVLCSFIRAPKITRVGKGVHVLAEHQGSPVLVRQGNVLAGTFHGEVRSETTIHALFIGSSRHRSG